MHKNPSKLALAFLLALNFSCSHKTFPSLNFSTNDAWVGEPNSGFRDLKSVSAKKFMISSASEESSKAGAEIMAKGGNAVDAAIAAQLVLTVVEPHSSGIGGGGFFLYFDKATNQTVYFDGRETAPAKAFDKMFLDQNGQPKKFADAVRGGLSVGTPGLLRAMRTAHNKFGKLPWAELFKPAIRAANEGFVASERFHVLSQQIAYLKDFGETAEIYLKAGGKPYEKGERITNHKLAKTLEKLARQGTKPFYEGKIAQDMVDAVQKSPINPGYLSLADLKNYRIRSGDLLCAKYRQKYKICSMPLPAGGVTLLQILGILENFDLAKLQPNSPQSVHLISEATRLAYADRGEYIGDVANVPVAKLLDKNYLKSRAALISADKAMTKVEPGNFQKIKADFALNNDAAELPSTTHMSVLDADGNAVSMTSSIEYFFGSAISVDGFLLNNQLTDFSFVPEKNGKKVANALAPNKRPRSSMSPSFVFDLKGNLIMIVGSPGGPRIIQSVVKTIVNHLDFGLDVQQAISLPSFVALNDVIELEAKQDIIKLGSSLQKMGHATKIVPIVSGINAITIEKKLIGKKILGGSDPRREGIALGE